MVSLNLSLSSGSFFLFMTLHEIRLNILWKCVGTFQSQARIKVMDTPQYPMLCNYLSMSQISVSGTIVLISRVSCQKGTTHHAYAWQIGPFWQDTLDICIYISIFGHQVIIANMNISWTSGYHCQYEYKAVYFSVFVSWIQGLNQSIVERSAVSTTFVVIMMPITTLYSILSCVDYINKSAPGERQRGFY